MMLTSLALLLQARQMLHSWTFLAPPVFRWTDGKLTCRCEVNLLVSQGGGVWLQVLKKLFSHLKHQQVTHFPFFKASWTLNLWLNPALKIDYIRFVVVTERHCLLVLPCRIGWWKHDVTRLGLLPARNNLFSHLCRGKKTKLNSWFSSLFTCGFQSRWTRLRTCCFSRRDDEVSSHVYSPPPMIPTRLSGSESWNKNNVINCIINWGETSVQDHFI